MDLRLSLGRAGSPRTVAVVGGLDLEGTTEFSQVILALHDIIGADVVYDLTGVEVVDDAARSTLTMLAHTFREFGRCVQLPETLDEHLAAAIG